MIRKRESLVIDTIYNKSFEDSAKKFNEPSKTQQCYYSECDIYTMLARGGVAARPLQFGEQSYDTLEDIFRVRREWELKFAALSPENKAKFGNIEVFMKWVSDPRNYEELYPQPEPKPEPEPEPIE